MNIKIDFKFYGLKHFLIQNNIKKNYLYTLF